MTFVILAAGTLVRMIGITRPLLGNFATKGVVYAMIARNFASDPGTLFYPTLGVMINGKPALHMTEWPFFSYFVGAVHRTLPWLSIDATGRACSAVFFMLSAWFFYLLFRRMFDGGPANHALMFYVFFPLGIIYGQSFQLESCVMFCITGLFYLVYSWIEGKRDVWRGVFIWSLASTLLLMKPQMICLALPVFALFAADRNGKGLLAGPGLYIFTGLCLIPPVVWYLHTFHVAQTSDNVFFSVLYSMKIRAFPDPRIFTPDFYLRIARTLSKEVFSPVGLALAGAGLFVIRGLERRKKYFVFAYIIAMAVSFLSLPRKIYEMNYYFMPVLVPGAILASYGLSVFRSRAVRGSVILIFIVVSVVIARNPAFRTPGNEKNYISAAEVIDQCIPEHARIIVSSAGSNMAFLYYTGRTGWTLDPAAVDLTGPETKAREGLGMETAVAPEKLLEKYREEGAMYYVCDDVSYLKRANRGLYRYLLANYSPVREKDYFIVRLAPRK